MSEESAEFQLEKSNARKLNTLIAVLTLVFLISSGSLKVVWDMYGKLSATEKQVEMNTKKLGLGGRFTEEDWDKGSGSMLAEMKACEQRLNVRMDALEGRTNSAIRDLKEEIVRFGIKQDSYFLGNKRR